MLFLALSSVLVVEAPMVPAFFTGDALYGFCTKPNQSECLMYVAGALDGLFYVRFSDGSVRLCPSRMTNAEAATLVVDYLEKNPEARRRAGAAVIRTALAPKIECSNREVATKD
jgi:hypothetical protein